MPVRREISLHGVVQGIGFRPWVARQASALGLSGSVCNTERGVHVSLEGSGQAIEAWLEAIRTSPPPSAEIESIHVEQSASRKARGFRIEPSWDRGVGGRTRIPHDAAVCTDCLQELFDPADRRYRYPFTHCAVCGPRASVIEDLPFDRERTTLRHFPLCTACKAEYERPEDRRYHAQTIACESCGPRVRALRMDNGAELENAVEAAVAFLQSGRIVAVKGYGGFHLAVDATSNEAVKRLRERKCRPNKPLAVLVPDLQVARRLAVLGEREVALLTGSERAVVIAPRCDAGCQAMGLARHVAPRTTDLGVLLPYAPLHWLLFYGPGTRPGRDAPRLQALVLTSANLSDEPTVHENGKAPKRLGAIADLILEHDRDVARPNDDSVFRSAQSGPIPIRLSRAKAPVALPLPPELRDAPSTVAVGGDLKCAPAMMAQGQLVLAEHVGDLACVEAVELLEERLRDLQWLIGVGPTVVGHDLHPGYLGTGVAGRLSLRTEGVQHHHAHAIACLLENGAAAPALALVLDGAGYGTDGTIWGCELLRVEYEGFERLAHLEQVALPGGDAAVREPWRMAAAWLDRAFPEGPPALPWHLRRDPIRLEFILGMASRRLRSPLTSSCGRLFDAIGSLLGLGDHVSHEGEAAVALESLSHTYVPEQDQAPLQGADPDDHPLVRAHVIPAADLVREVVSGIARGSETALIGVRFQERLADRLASYAVDAAVSHGIECVALTGGCFQNRLLLDSVGARLAGAGLRPLTHRKVPPNDGGLAVGQAVIAAARSLNGTGPSSGTRESDR